MDVSEIRSDEHLLSERKIKRDKEALKGKQLKRSLGFLHVFACVVGVFIGSGFFLSPSLVAAQTVNMGMALLAWLIAGLICLFASLCCCELAVIFRNSGGLFFFIKKTYGDIPAFLANWTQVLIITPCALVVLSITIAEHIVEPLCTLESQHGVRFVKGVAILCILVGFLINCMTAEFVGRTQIYLTMFQVAVVTVLVAIGVWRVANGHVENYSRMFLNTGQQKPIKFVLALYNALWSFEGWGTFFNIAEEQKNLEKDLKLALLTGIPFMTFCYIILNLAFMSTLSHRDFASSRTLVSKFVSVAIGEKGGFVTPIFVALSVFGSYNAFLFTSARALMSASREGYFPEPFSYIHLKRRTPVPALLALLILTLIWTLLLGSQIQELITYFTFAVWFISGLAIFAVIVLRVRFPDIHRPYKTWLVNPIIMTLVACCLILLQWYNRFVDSVIASGVILAGIPMYVLFVSNQYKMPLCMMKERVYTFVAVQFNLVSCVSSDDDVD